MCWLGCSPRECSSETRWTRSTFSSGMTTTAFQSTFRRAQFRSLQQTITAPAPQRRPRRCLWLISCFKTLSTESAFLHQAWKRRERERVCVCVCVCVLCISLLRANHSVRQLRVLTHRDSHLFCCVHISHALFGCPSRIRSRKKRVAKILSSRANHTRNTGFRVHKRRAKAGGSKYKKK